MTSPNKRGTLGLSPNSSFDESELLLDDNDGNRDKNRESLLVTSKKVAKMLTTDSKELLVNLVHTLQVSDPLWIFAQPDKEKRQTLIKDFFAENWTNYFFKHGHIWGVLEKDSNTLLGASVLLAPDVKFDVSFSKFLKNSASAPNKMGTAAFNRYFKVAKRASKKVKKIMQKKPFLRVMHPSPASFEISVARVLMKVIIKAALAENFPVYHEVYSLEHVQFLRHYGFESVGSETVTAPDSQDSMTFWVMVRWPKEGTGEIENELSIVRDPAIRKALYKKIPEFQTVVDVNSVDILSMEGPKEDGLVQTAFDSTICIHSISTYPFDRSTGRRQGEPNADRYQLCMFNNCTIVALLDGCGWGIKARDAAVKASNAFIRYMIDTKYDIFNATQACKYMLRAYEAANNAIIEGKSGQEIYDAGTTTMLGGILLELSQKTAHHTHVFVLVNLGDCKAYHLSAQTGQIVDLTAGNRSTDPKDPGGRIGPYLEEGKPDLRNLDTNYVLCAESDIIILATDGIHDNVDAEYLGHDPEDLGLQPSEPGKWSSLEKGVVVKAKTEWNQKFLTDFIGGKKATPKTINEKLIQHCLKLTEPSREFMENPDTATKKLPTDYKTFPGKMDHTTIVSFAVRPARS